MENMKDLICNNFIRLMSASILSKREVAKRIGVNENTLQRWKNKESCPELSNIESLAHVLEVSPLEFYKTKEQIVERVEPVSVMARKLLAIPDDIYELAQGVEIDDPQWENVRSALEVARERKGARKESNSR